MCSALGYLDGTILQPSPGTPTVSLAPLSYWGSATPTPDKWSMCDNWTQSLITLNVVNAIGLGIQLTGSAAETYKSIADIKDTTTNLGYIIAENRLNEIKYPENTDMSKHILKLWTAWALRNAQGA